MNGGPPRRALENRSALVTRRSSELGQEIALALEQAGARVVPLDDAAEAHGTAPGELVAGALGASGRLDILVTVPALLPPTPAELLAVAQFKQDVAMNLGAVFFWCQAAAERMRRQEPAGGCIINVSSVGGVLALPGQSAFCAAMAGVIAMTQVLATEWQPYGVRVVGVGAGISRELAAGGTLDLLLPDGITPSHHRAPEHTVIPAAEVARVVAFLASDAARSINGTTVFADGGWLADGYWE